MVYENDVIGVTETSDVGVVSLTFADSGDVIVRDFANGTQLEVNEFYDFDALPLPATFSVAALVNPGSILDIFRYSCQVCDRVLLLFSFFFLLQRLMRAQLIYRVSFTTSQSPKSTKFVHT